MIIDGALQFTGTAGTAGSADSPTTGTQQSTNIIDLVNARDMGIGDSPSLEVVCQVTVAFTGGTSLQIQLQGAPDNGSGSPGTYSTYAETAAILEAQLTAGRNLFPITVPRPNPGAANPRFYRLQYVTAGTHTAGSIFACIVLDRNDQVQYPAGVTVPN